MKSKSFNSRTLRCTLDSIYHFLEGIWLIWYSLGFLESKCLLHWILSQIQIGKWYDLQFGLNVFAKGTGTRRWNDIERGLIFKRWGPTGRYTLWRVPILNMLVWFTISLAVVRVDCYKAKPHHMLAPSTNGCIPVQFLAILWCIKWHPDRKPVP